MTNRSCHGLDCIVCGARVFVGSAVADDFESCEMIHIPANAWVGFVQNDSLVDGNTTKTMVVCCSEPCLSALLNETG